MPRRRVISGDTEWNPHVTGSGDFWNPEPTPLPRSSSGGSRREATPAPRAMPTPTATPDFYENERGVFRNYPSVTIFPDGPDFAGFRGDEFYSGDFDSPRESTYSHTPGVGTARLEPSFLFGSPAVETPTASGRGSAGNLDAEPSLFPNPNEWWKGDAFAGATASGSLSTNDGGSIWEGADTMGDFVGGASLGQDLSADLGSMNFGDRPAIDAPNPGEVAFNQPPPPGPLEETNEWTTSPGDRRFLPNAAGEPTVETPRASGRGGDITSFGTFGNPLTLGSFFGNSLESMRFGTDRYVQGGEVSQTGEVAGGLWTDPATGETINLDDLPVATGGTTVTPGEFNAWPRGELLSPQPPPGMRIIGHDKRNGQPIYEDSNGKRFVNPGTGSRINPAFSDPDSYYAGTFYNYGTGQRESLRETGSFRDSSNQGAEQQGRIRQTTTDAGHNQFLFNPGEIMFLNSEGGFEASSVDRPESDPALRGWANLVTSAKGRASVARGLPQAAGNTYGGRG